MKPSSLSPTPKKSYKSYACPSSVIVLISGAFGFIISTCTLLLIWSSYLQSDTSSNYATQDVLSNWEWHRYSDSGTNHTINRPAPRYLIVQLLPDHVMCGYDEALKITSRVNRAYAKKWRVDYVKEIMPENNLDFVELSTLPDNMTGTKRYIAILRDILRIGLNNTSAVDAQAEAVNHSVSLHHYQYDYVWIYADPSMMVVDFEKEIFDNKHVLLTSLEPSNIDEPEDSLDLYQNPIINEGALLWNLKHDHTSNLLDLWERLDELGDALISASGLMQGASLHRFIPDDTFFTLYHFPFDSMHRQEVSSCSNGTKALHPTKQSKIKLQSMADMICFRYFPSCDLV